MAACFSFGRLWEPDKSFGGPTVDAKSCMSLVYYGAIVPKAGGT